MKRATKGIFLILSFVCLYSTQALAQREPPSGPLADFLLDPTVGATTLQQETGFAVQAACASLNAYAISQGGQNGFDLTGTEGDLFERCNEMVQTAADLRGSTTTTRSLGYTENGELLAVMQQVSGEELLTQETLSTRVTNGQFSNIAGRLNAVRLGGASAAMGGRVASTGTYDDPSRSTPDYKGVSIDSRMLSGGGAAGDADIAGSRFGWFLEGSFNTGDRDETPSEDGFDFDATSFTLGVDYLLDSGVIGASLGIDNYDADFRQSQNVSGGNVNVEGVSGSLFGAFFRDAWYFDGILSFGTLDTDTSRLAFYPSNNPLCTPAPCPGNQDTLQGQTDGDHLAVGATVGYDINRGNWDITPSLALAYRNVDMDGYTEVDPNGGGLMLAYDKQEFKSLKTVAGIAFTGNYSRSFGILSPLIRVEWHHEFEDDPSRLIAKYAVEDQLAMAGVTGAAGAGDFNLAQCISCFVINGEEVDSDFGVISLGLSAVFSQRIQIYGVYDGLVGFNHLTSNAFSAGIRGQF